MHVRLRNYLSTQAQRIDIDFHKNICTFSAKKKRGSESIEFPMLTTCAGNWLRTITSDQTVYNTIRRFLFELVGMTSLDRNYWEVTINLLFVSSGLCLNIFKTEKILAILGQETLDVRGTSFQRKRLNSVVEKKKIKKNKKTQERKRTIAKRAIVSQKSAERRILKREKKRSEQRWPELSRE